MLARTVMLAIVILLLTNVYAMMENSCITENVWKIAQLEAIGLIGQNGASVRQLVVVVHRLILFFL